MGRTRLEDGFVKKDRRGDYESDKYCKYTKTQVTFSVSFQLAVVFCFEREFQMHNLTFHFSPRASKLLRISMNKSYELH